MKPWMQITLLAVVAALIGGTAGFGWGFYRGAKTGAEIMRDALAYDKIQSALSLVDSSVTALNKNDPAYSIAQHQRDLNAALVVLGGYAPAAREYWKCKNVDQAIIGDAGNYLKAHPETKGKGLSLDQPATEQRTFGQLLDQALKFCQ